MKYLKKFGRSIEHEKGLEAAVIGFGQLNYIVNPPEKVFDYGGFYFARNL